jgi:hypothetical protein
MSGWKVARGAARAENRFVHACRQCQNDVEDSFRYCPWCATAQRRKLVEFFPPHPAMAGDARKALRVSRYLGDEQTAPQVRFSIWSGDAAEAAVSLTEEEAARLASFVAPPAPRRALLDQLRESLHL